MPRKRNFKKKNFKKKTFNRKKGKFKVLNDYSKFGLPKTMPIYTNFRGFPQSRMAKLTFTLSQVDGGGAGTGPSLLKNYLANSIWQCLNATAGNALGFTPWGNFYNVATVLQSKCEVTVSCAGGSAVPIIAIIHLDNGTAVAGGAQRAIDQPNTVYNVTTSSASVTPIRKLRLSYNAKTFNGVDNVIDDNQLAQIIVNPAPVYPAIKNYFNVLLQSSDNATNLPATYALVRITYLVYFSEPNDLAN